jgi:ComF family protein
MTDPARPAAATSRQREMTAFARVADWLLPPLCLVCQRGLAAHDSLCPVCWRDVRFISHPLCDRLGIPLPYDTGEVQLSAGALAEPPDYDRARAVAHYAGPVRLLIHRLKYQDRLEPRALLARWMTTAGRDVLADAHVLVPVPLFRRRLLWRRFNQSALLGREIARLTGLPVEPLALQRLKNTRAQVGLSESQRALNVRGAFKVPASGKPLIEGRNVVLLDDVITTGATVNACARALRRAGAARIDVLAIAMATDLSRTLE